MIARNLPDETPNNVRPSELPALIGCSPAISELRSKLALVATSEATVLLTGESGTGKEVAARMIHSLGRIAHRPFVAVNAAALPRDVVDNELFGHEREAFTGAVSKRTGCFELAAGGTLFLDEIGEMHAQTQAKLLRAIENRSFRRLGGREEVQVTARVVAATNRNIASAIANGELREDLYYRISVVELQMPALRERREDIPLLIDYFMRSLSSKYRREPLKITDAAMGLLMSYQWPGNVRELRNLIERLYIICASQEVLPFHLAGRISEESTAPAAILSIPVGTSLEAAERLLIDNTLAAVSQNKSAAARILGISRRTLHNKLADRTIIRDEPLT